MNDITKIKIPDVKGRKITFEIRIVDTKTKKEIMSFGVAPKVNLESIDGIYLVGRTIIGLAEYGLKNKEDIVKRIKKHLKKKSKRND